MNLKPALAAPLLCLALALGACGEDEEPTTTSSSTTATTTETGPTGPTGPTDASAPAGGGDTATLDEAIAKLEAAGYTVEPVGRADLTEVSFLPKPVTALGGYYAEKGGATLEVAQYASPAQAEQVETAIDKSFVEGEIASGTLIVSLTEDTTDEIAAAVAVIEG